MRHTNTYIPARAKKVLSAWTIACIVLTLVRGPSTMVQTAEAASSFRPTIFVNTEAFLIIDDDDTTADVVMRFGDTLAKTLSFNRTLDRFQFNDDVYVTGTVQATNTLSGAVVYGAKSLRSSGSLVWEGAASGSSLIVSNNVGIAVTAAKAKLSVNGIMSGVTVYATRSFSGAGLADCDNATNSKLLWDSATGRFSCGTDTNTNDAWGGGNFSFYDGNSQEYIDQDDVVTFTDGTGIDVVVSGTDTITVSSNNDYANDMNQYVGTDDSVTFSEIHTNGTSYFGDDPSDNIAFAGTVGTDFVPQINDNFNIGSSTARWNTGWFDNADLSGNLNVLGTSSLTGNVGIGASATTTKAKLSVNGVMSGVTVYATRSFSGAGLSDCDTAGTSKLLWDATTGRFSCGTDSGATYTAGQGLTLNGSSFRLNTTVTGSLASFQTVSGALVKANNTLASSGTLVVEGQTTLNNRATVEMGSAADGLWVRSSNGGWLARFGDVGGVLGGYRDVRISNKAIQAYDTTEGDNTSILQLNPNGGRVGVGMANPDAALDVQGTISGSLVTQNGAGNNSFMGNVGVGTTAPKTKLEVAGAISGSFIYATKSFSGAGLTDCDSGTSKLLWDATTGRFSCGTVTSSNWSGTGALQNAFDARYVNAAGDTMTGKLTIDLTNNALVGLEVNEMMSGARLQITGSGMFQGGATDDVVLTVKGSAGQSSDLQRWQDSNGTTLANIGVSGNIYSNSNVGAPSMFISGLLDCNGANALATDGSGNIYCDIDDNTGYDDWGNGYFNISDGSTQEAITNGGAINFSDGTGIDVVVSATDTVTINSNNVYANNMDQNVNTTADVMLNSIDALTEIEASGSISGALVIATGGFYGAGLADCDSGTSKLLWDAATSRFSCGTVTSTTYTAGQGLALNGTSFSLGQTISGTLLEFQTVSGSTVYGSKTIRSSGSLVVEGTTTLGGNIALTNDVDHSISVTGSSTTPGRSISITAGEGSASPGGNLNLRAGQNLAGQGGNVVISAGTGGDIGNAGGNAYLFGGPGFSGGTPGNVFLGVTPGGTAIGNVGIGKSLAKAKLDVLGTISGSSIQSFGLVDCDSGTSKLLWDATTGRFSCGTVTATNWSGTGSLQTAFDARYIRKSGGTMTGKLQLTNTMIAVTGSGVLTGYDSNDVVLTVKGAVSQSADLQRWTDSNDAVSASVSTSTFSINSNLSTNANVSIGDNGSDTVTVNALVGSSLTPNSNNSYSIGNSSNRWATGWFVNANLAGDFNVSGNSNFVGNVSTNSSVLLGDGTSDNIYFGGDVNSSFNPDTNNSYSFGNSSNRWNTGWFVHANVGSDLTVGGNTAIGDSNADNISFAGDVNTSFNPNTNNSHDMGNSSFRWAAGWFNSLNTSAGLSVQGTSSLTGNVGIGSANSTTKAVLAVTGTISGATVYATKSFSGAGLTDCDSGTSKLLWDATTGRFSCGTVTTTNWSNTGSLQLAFDGRYVKKSGDTMTGALTVQNGNTHAATLTALLNIRGTMSGRNLYVSGSGSSPLLSTTTGKPAVRIGGSGSLVIETRSSDPGSAPANTVAVFAQKTAGRPMLMQASGATMAATALQTALFGNQIMVIKPGGGATLTAQGTQTLDDTTVSHPTADQVFGFMANFATAATSGDDAGTSSSNTAAFRGSTAGANGFFSMTRVGVVDTTSIRVFSGMADQTVSTMVSADNPSGNFAGFQFSTGRGDSNWQFTTKDNSTQSTVNTGMAFSANKVYDLYFMCTKQCAAITWEILNVTDGTKAAGTTSSNLPSTTAALRMVLGVESQTTAAKNIRMQQMYFESDR